MGWHSRSGLSSLGQEKLLLMSHWLDHTLCPQHQGTNQAVLSQIINGGWQNIPCLGTSTQEQISPCSQQELTFSSTRPGAHGPCSHQELAFSSTRPGAHGQHIVSIFVQAQLQCPCPLSTVGLVPSTNFISIPKHRSSYGPISRGWLGRA